MNYVDAIEEGKIVRVSEEYAKKENLFILKKVEPATPELSQSLPGWKKRERDEKRALFDDFRKPLRYTKDPILSELIDNFHWTLLEKRKSKNITRKQLAQSLNVSEADIKIIENGVLPSRDFVLINKLEKFYGINLRKGNINYQDSFRSKALHSETEPREQKREQDEQKAKNQNISTSGSDIEIID